MNRKDLSEEQEYVLNTLQAWLTDLINEEGMTETDAMQITDVFWTENVAARLAAVDDA